MTSLMIWFSSPAAGSLYWSLLHSLWQGMLWSLVLAIVLTLIPRSKPNLRYSASLGCLIGMALGVLVTWSILRLPAGTLTAATIGERAVDIQESDPTILTAPPLGIPPVYDNVADTRPGQRGVTKPPRWQEWIFNQLDQFSPLFVGAWALGVVFCLLRCVRHRSAAATWRRGDLIRDPAVVELLHTLKSRM
ncbi:hypothetical protein [Planctomicrobium sp. SH527]|uniref:hypothetical protein n=1 Tax=Planctomicrobium sp. SH527 TaxID=3448123 RepID=UPI003F5B1080